MMDKLGKRNRMRAGLNWNAYETLLFDRQRSLMVIENHSEQVRQFLCSTRTPALT